MHAIRELPGNAKFVGLSMIVAAGILVIVICGRAWTWYLDGSSRLIVTEPRYARLVGFSQNVELLRESRRLAKSQLAELTYPGSSDMTSASATAQQEIRRILEAAGLRVSGSQVLSPEDFEGYAQLRIDVNAGGSMDGLERALQGIQDARPLIFVRSVDLSPERQRRGENTQEVSVGLSLSVVKLQ